MSYFDFPRINFSGQAVINVGTVNNDDYSAGNPSYFKAPDGSMQILRVSDSLNVQPMMYGMSENDFITWTMTPQTVYTKQADGTFTQQAAQLIPGEWNYYGDMGVTLKANVVSVTLSEGNTQTTNALVGASVSFNNDAGRSAALICDVNPEDVPSSQMFADVFSIRDSSGKAIFQGPPSKAVTRWINFVRNVNKGGSAGASGVFQSVIPVSSFSDPALTPMLTALGLTATTVPAGTQGFVVRYNYYLTVPPINGGDLAALQTCYAQEPYINQELGYAPNQNPGIASISGTIGLWGANEMRSITMGRYLVPGNTFSTTPYVQNNGGGTFTLAPAVAKLNGSLLSIDVINTFPEVYTPAAGSTPASNNKFDILTANKGSAMCIGVSATNSYSNITFLANLDYSNTTEYINNGGLIDITLTADQVTAVEAGYLVVYMPQSTTKTVTTVNKSGQSSSTTQTVVTNVVLLGEIDYMMASDQCAVYAEEGQQDFLYRNDGPAPASCFINIYQKGAPLQSTITLAMQESATTPNDNDHIIGYPTKLVVTPENNNQMQLRFDASSCGNLLYRFALADAGSSSVLSPVANYGDINLGTDFYINLRVLPTNDYSEYIDANGNATQTIPWDYLYSNVLQYYNLIFPAMSLHVPFEEPVWIDMAAAIYQRVDVSKWGSIMYMPRTRDLSDPRRQLIQAWCKQHMPTPPAATAPSSTSTTTSK